VKKCHTIVPPRSDGNSDPSPIWRASVSELPPDGSVENVIASARDDGACVTTHAPGSKRRTGGLPLSGVQLTLDGTAAADALVWELNALRAHRAVLITELVKAEVGILDLVGIEAAEEDFTVILVRS